VLVRVDPSLYRPLEAENYCADYSKARRILEWKPRARFTNLVRIMVEHELGASHPRRGAPSAQSTTPPSTIVALPSLLASTPSENTLVLFSVLKNLSTLLLIPDTSRQ
jgi:hypothetical protein